MIHTVKNVLQKKHVIMIIGIVLVLVLFFAFRAMAAEEVPELDVQGNAIMVEVEEVILSDFLAGTIYKAELEPVEQAVVSSSVTGQVTQVLFENGDHVAAGQALAYLDQRDLQSKLSTTTIDLNKMQLDLAAKERDYLTAKELYEDGAFSKVNYENAELAYRTEQANVELKRIALQDINKSLADCVIKAPISGEISDKKISLGQYANTGTAIAEVKNNSSIKALIQLNQADLSKVAVGEHVTLKLGETNGRSYDGVVETIADSANSQSRVFDCLIRVNNADGTLNSGVYGYVEIVDQHKTQTLVVPVTAVNGSEGNYFVYTIEDQKAKKVPVELGEMKNEKAEILSGMQAGDKIITSNLSSLHDGDKVEVSGEGK